MIASQIWRTSATPVHLTPLEWFIDRYRITRDDPNAWFDDPRELVAMIRRIVHISVESTRINIRPLLKSRTYAPFTPRPTSASPA